MQHPQDVEILADVDAEQQQALPQTLLVTVGHFFGGFPRLFQSVTNPRNPLLITYRRPWHPPAYRGQTRSTGKIAKAGRRDLLRTSLATRLPLVKWELGRCTFWY